MKIQEPINYSLSSKKLFCNQKKKVTVYSISFVNKLWTNMLILTLKNWIDIFVPHIPIIRLFAKQNTMLGVFSW